MVPTITDQQRSAISAAEGAGVPVIDPVEQRTYYLVPAELYEQLHSGGATLDGAYPLMDEVARHEGWDDSEMDAYDRLDPRKQA
jgi:hypothetical protein